MRASYCVNLCLCCWMYGCGATTGSNENGASNGVPTQVQELPVHVIPAEGVREVVVACHIESEERCDGVDQNCDGRVDEGCGYQNAGLDLTIVWNSGVDLRIALSPGEAVSDHDGAGDCASDDPHPRVASLVLEDVRFQSYRVQVVEDARCGVDLPDGEVTTVSVAGSVNSQSFGVYTAELSAGSLDLITLEFLDQP